MRGESLSQHCYNGTAPRGGAARRSTPALLFENFLDVAEFLLYLASQVFPAAFRFEVRIVSDLADFFFRSALRFVYGALNLIFRTFVNGVNLL